MKENKTVNIFLFVLIVSVFTYAGINYFLREKSLEKTAEANATVVEVFKGNAYRSPEFKVIYYVNGRQYSNWHRQKSNPYRVGDRLEVQYSINDPKYARIQKSE